VHGAQRPPGLVLVGDKKNGGGPLEGMGQNQRIKKNGLFKWFQIYLGFKNQRIQNIFKLKFELGYTKINLNKLFGDFSNLELLEIDLNNQIEIKTLNGRLLN
jgi:hypothetical protein